MPSLDPPRVDGSSRAAMLASILDMEASLSAEEQTELAYAIEEASLVKMVGKDIISTFPPTARHPIRPFRVVRALLEPDERSADTPRAILARWALAGKTVEEIMALAAERSQMTDMEKVRIAHEIVAQNFEEKAQLLCETARFVFSRVKVKDFRLYSRDEHRVMESTFANESPYAVREIMLEAQHVFPGESTPRARRTLSVNWPALHHAVHVRADVRAMNPWIWEEEERKNPWQPRTDAVLAPGETKRQADWASDDFPLRDAPEDAYVELEVTGVVAAANDGWHREWWFVHLDRSRPDAIFCGRTSDTEPPLYVYEQGIPDEPARISSQQRVLSTLHSLFK
jgi:hypothetical protein